MKYINSPYNSASCPICSNTENRLLYNVSSNSAAIQFLAGQNLADKKDKVDIMKDKLTRLWKCQTASVIACESCGFTFADPFIAGDYEFYNIVPHATAEMPEIWKWEFNKTYKKIEEFSTGNQNLHLLEIGSSTGDFIKRICDFISKENILCIEHSEIGIQSIQKSGITARAWDFHELGKKDEFQAKFDIICLFQVLEHLDKLDDTFETFNAVIKPGGHLFIGVPNGKKIEFNELNNALLDIPPNHLGRYNKNNFEFLGDKYGWEIEEIEIEDFTPLDVMKTVMFSQSLKRLQHAPVKETIWYRIKQYIAIKHMRVQAFFRHKDLGDTLWVHYKKS